MINVNTKSGKTLTFDLKKDFDEWSMLSNDFMFQKNITGIGIIHNKNWYILPLPECFSSSSMFFAEVVKHRKRLRDVGERIICCTENFQFSLLVYYKELKNIGNVDLNNMCRFDIIKIDKSPFKPIVKNYLKKYGK